MGLVTGIASKLLEIEGGGPVDNIEWKLKNLDALGLVKGGAEGVTKIGKGAVEITGKGTEKAVEGVKSVGKGLKKILPFGKKK